MIARQGNAPRPKTGAQIKPQKYMTRHLTAGDEYVPPRSIRRRRKTKR